MSAWDEPYSIPSRLPRRPLQSVPSHAELMRVVDDLKAQLEESRRPTEGKPPWQSKTLWVNGLVVAAAVLGYILDSADVLVVAGIDSWWFAIGGVALGGINIVLRTVTREPLAGMEE